MLHDALHRSSTLTGSQSTSSSSVPETPPHHLKGLPLADPNFFANARIELLLGADLFQLFVQSSIEKSTFSGPVGQKTSLGWILTTLILVSALHHLIRLLLHLLKSLILMTSCFFLCKPFGK